MRGWLSVSCDPGGEPTLTGSGVTVADGVHTASSGRYIDEALFEYSSSSDVSDISSSVAYSRKWSSTYKANLALTLHCEHYVYKPS